MSQCLSPSAGVLDLEQLVLRVHVLLVRLPPELQRRLLSDIADAFGSVPGVTATAVLAARVPICTMTFPSDLSSPAGAPLVLTSDLVVDVSVGNVIALDNTRLIRTYMEVDECAWQLCRLSNQSSSAYIQLTEALVDDDDTLVDFKIFTRVPYPEMHRMSGRAGVGRRA